jgi:quinolinate synthase
VSPRPLSERKRVQAERARFLARALDVEILAHFYQRAEVKDLADVVGGSRALYQRVRETRHRRVLVCGVSFMRAAMERLRPDLEILVPRADAGCPLSDPVGAAAVSAIRAAADPFGLPPMIVADVKASAEVRDLADIVLYSEPLWPEGWTRRPVHVLPTLSAGDPAKTPHGEAPGAVCQVHRQVEAEAVREARGRQAPVLVIANSLCRPEVRAMADHVGDSQSIWDWCAAKRGERFLVVAESGLVESLSEAFPESRFIETGTEVFCPNMKLVNIKDALAALEAVRTPEPLGRPSLLPAGVGD